MKSKQLIYSVLLFFFCINITYGAKITAALDSVTLLMGKKAAIHIEVVEPENSAGRLVLNPEDHIIPQIEVSDIITLDSANIGNSLRQIKKDIIIQSFDSGEYIIPAIKYLIGKDTIESNELAIKVMPVNVSHLKTINSNADVEDYESKWYDFLPDFIIDYWGWLIIILLLLCAGVYVYMLYRKKALPNPFKHEEPKLSPYEVAIRDLNVLKEQNLCATGQEKVYYTNLTDILRIYLQDRFGINALEMTTSQITRALNSNPETKSHNDMIRQILEVADFVKFAKVRPLPEDNVRSFNSALRFVEDTKPAPEPEETKTETNNTKQ